MKCFIVFVLWTNLCFVAAGRGGADWQVWTVTDTRCVLRDEPAGATMEARLTAARNQSRGFQILVRSDAPVKGVRVEAGDLQGPDGCVIRAAAARLYRQHQIEITKPTVRNDHFKPGGYPDALIPFEHPLTRTPLQGARLEAVPFNLPAHETHGFWVDLYAPPEAKPGEYRGVYRVTADGEKAFSVPVALTVWDFQLPMVPTFRTAFGSPADGLRFYYQRRAKQGKEKAPADWDAVETQCAELLSQHRINATPPPLIPAEQADGTFHIPDKQVAALRAFVDRYHINAMQVIHPNSAVKDPVAQRERLHAWLKSFDEAAAKLDRPGLLFYTYLKDEPGTAADYKYVQTWGRAVRDAKSVVKVLVVEQPNPENAAWGNLYGAVDIWCPLFSLFEPKPVEERLALGETVWTYTALCQEKPTPWWHIDYPLLNYRVPAWIAWRYRVSGILYWSMTYWAKVDDPWKDPITYGNGATIYNGEGTLVYPGQAVGYDGIAPSLRLKALRDSIDDYEYLAILQRLGLAAEAEKIVLPLAGSWFQWDPDPAAYEIARVKLAKMIVSARGGKSLGKSAGPADVDKEHQTRVRANVDAQWKFFKGDAAGAEQTNYDDQNWQAVNLPHDWTIEGPVEQSNRRYNGFFPSGIGWYRKNLKLDGSFADRQVYLEFEGVYRNSALWVNGQKVGSHLSGYTGVVYDITPYVHCDGKPNVLAVRVDGREAEGWWYEGCGIYRHVWLIATDTLHVANWGTFVTTPEVSDTKATVRLRTTVQNDTSSEQQCRLETKILDAQGRTVATMSSEDAIPAKSVKDVSQDAALTNPRLWSPDTPYLYRAHTDVIVSGEKVDTYETPFGVRWFEFTADRGFFLNGKHVQLRGMCNHHDFGGLGVALPDRANEKTVEVMKAMGCNFLRSSHNDAAPALLEACDRLGLLVWAETRYLAPVERAGPPLRDLIRRSRNHPCIICWSLANTAGSKNGPDTKYLKDLNDVAHEEDPSRPTAFACEGNADANANGFALVTDIMGYNGGGMGIDDRDHKLYPQRKMVISEFSSGRGARGVYEDKVLGTLSTETLGDGRQVEGGKYCNIYGLCRAHEAEWSHIAQRTWLAGGAMWSGIDYAGETAGKSGWPLVTSQFGVLDLCRFPNDAYYYYLQEWTAAPMVHVFPHWTWPGKEGKPIQVWVYSNCDSVELLLNGKSLGVKPRKPLGHMEWYVPYQSGTLLARASKDGSVACSEEIKTAGPPARIKLAADRRSIAADGCDLSFITAQIEDRDGNLVPTASNEISVAVGGHGRLLGLCSGDPGSHENPKAGHMKAFNSLLLAVVQNDGLPGQISVNASSPGLTAGTINLIAR